MHGLTARALESFVRNTYGEKTWANIAWASGLQEEGFELMLAYPPELTDRVLAEAAIHLARTREEVLEDLGTFLVSHPRMQPLRRLFRYGGADFRGFLESLGDLPERARLALPHAVLPPLSATEEERGRWSVECGHTTFGLVHVLLGAIRAMADDYGALAVAQIVPSPEAGSDRIEIEILAGQFAEGRHFELKLSAE
ncbi:heme NO-binding domain-containing protein [Palleronia abyssalis]|uniref:Heme NO-binding domain-containing protein n=1 Tax=Palleronia abyssalis TaxID=1501240 RepID=A0A2R8BYN3_9RHOB|nr:heme NO-binding domain-containing protein [Palleronia abyssalis]SPJ25250.1 hypothetical protein PAA8504_03101 [Palleronia abyssalis]